MSFYSRTLMQGGELWLQSCSSAVARQALLQRMVHLKGDFFGNRDNTHCNSLQCLLIISSAHLAAQLCAS